MVLLAIYHHLELRVQLAKTLSAVIMGILLPQGLRNRTVRSCPFSGPCGTPEKTVKGVECLSSQATGINAPFSPFSWFVDHHAQVTAQPLEIGVRGELGQTLHQGGCGHDGIGHRQFVGAASTIAASCTSR